MFIEALGLQKQNDVFENVFTLFVNLFVSSKEL